MSWCCPEAQQGALRHVLVPRVEPESLVTGEGVSEGHDALDGLRESLGGPNSVSWLGWWAPQFLETSRCELFLKPRMDIDP